MRLYVTMFLVAGVVVPIALHVVAADRMPWWPDTVSIGITFGVCAVVMAWKARADREMNHRLWTVLKAWGIAIGSHFRLELTGASLSAAATRIQPPQARYTNVSLRVRP